MAGCCGEVGIPRLKRSVPPVGGANGGTGDDIPQTKHLMTTRHASDDATRAMVDWLNRTFGYELTVDERPSYGGATYLHIGNDKPRDNGYGWQSHDVHRYMQAIPLLCSACNAATLPADAYCPQCGTTQQPIPLNV